MGHLLWLACSLKRQWGSCGGTQQAIVDAGADAGREFWVLGDVVTDEGSAVGLHGSESAPGTSEGPFSAGSLVSFPLVRQRAENSSQLRWRATPLSPCTAVLAHSSASLSSLGMAGPVWPLGSRFPTLCQARLTFPQMRGSLTPAWPSWPIHEPWFKGVE